MPDAPHEHGFGPVTFGRQIGPAHYEAEIGDCECGVTWAQYLADLAAALPSRGSVAYAAPRLPLAVRQGSEWCWAPLKPHAKQECRITAVKWNGEEWWVEAEATSGPERGKRYWNELDSWVESAVLVKPGPQEGP